MCSFDSAQFERLFPDLHTHPGTSSEVIAKIQSDLGMQLPKDYQEFLLWSDGAAGWLSADSFIGMVPAAEIAEGTKDCGITEFIPGLALLGSSGGGMALCFTWHNGKPEYVWIPFDNLIERQVRVLGPTFLDAMRALAENPEWRRDRTL